MRAYILRRLLSMIPVLFIVSILTFGLLFILPGDPVLAVLGEDLGDSETYLALKKAWGLDQPVYVQYGRWLGRVLRGDFGTSIKTGEPVSAMLMRRVPVSLLLGVAGMLVSILIGVPVALISALKPGSHLDTIGTVLAMAGVAIPGFWLGIMLMYLFAVQLRWLPPSGFTSPFVDPVLSAKMLIMPALSIGSRSAATLMRQGRSALLEVLQQDYITTARAKGLIPRLVINRHALKNAALPVVTILGLQIGMVVSGAAITETVFAIPGVGRAAVDAIFDRDYVVLQGAVLLLTLTAMTGNLLADLAYAYLDPRIRYH